MKTKKRRALTWALAALGVVCVALGGVLLATRAWPAETGHYGAHSWAQGQVVPVGGLFFAGIAGLVIFLLARRKRCSSAARNGADTEADAVELLRCAFAEGNITEEEYKCRLNVLRE